MLAVASLKRSLEFDPVEQGVKRKRAEMKLPTTTTASVPLPNSPSKQQEQAILLPPKSSISKASALSSVTDDTPIFTHTQTAQRCAQLLREQDRSLREQYEQLLLTKLNEQYEQFIRYSHDNIYKNSSKQKLFHFGQQKQPPSTSDSDASSSIDLSYIS